MMAFLKPISSVLDTGYSLSVVVFFFSPPSVNVFVWHLLSLYIL